MVMAGPPPAFSPEHYINRELSWLEFNARVLEEARDLSNPLLERLKFLCIFSSNLDEFFEVRVGGLQQQRYAGTEPQDYGADGLDPEQQLAAIEKRTHALVAQQYACWSDDVRPALRARQIVLVDPAEWSPGDQRYLEDYFDSQVFPVLTPLVIDPGHPFPHVHNKSLNLILQIERPAAEPAAEGLPEELPPRLFAVVQVPAVLDRLVPLPSHNGMRRFVLLEDVIGRQLDKLFGGFRVYRSCSFRVTRNSDLTIDEVGAESLLKVIQENLRRRRRGEAVRLEISAAADQAFVKRLSTALDLEPRDVYPVAGPVDLTPLMRLYRLDGYRELRDEPFTPRVPAALVDVDDAAERFGVIRQQDILIHHPYESFQCIVDLIAQAAEDPHVLAIKQTLYRTSGDSPIVAALARAAENGKQVTALVELQARFDEENNINWARSLERAGVHVVYGLVGLKTHCKAALIVRREDDRIRRYVHLSTGNYNPTTATIYTDLALMTAEPELGEDATALFNLLTGYSQGYQWRKLVVAPTDFFDRVLELIDRERRNALAGRPAGIKAKMNSLVEPTVIDALYHASQAGVPIHLVVRGICCLRPGLPGVSETIRVTSIVDKYLEHSRIFCFENGGDPDVYLSSADWMPRNFFRRVEVMFPIEAAQLREQIIQTILALTLADNVKARELRPDGTYVRVVRRPDEPAIRSQVEFQNLAREAARTAVETDYRVILPATGPKRLPVEDGIH